MAKGRKGRICCKFVFVIITLLYAIGLIAFLLAIPVYKEPISLKYKIRDPAIDHTKSTTPTNRSNVVSKEFIIMKKEADFRTLTPSKNDTTVSTSVNFYDETLQSVTHFFEVPPKFTVKIEFRYYKELFNVSQQSSKFFEASIKQIMINQEVQARLLLGNTPFREKGAIEMQKRVSM